MEAGAPHAPRFARRWAASSPSPSPCFLAALFWLFMVLMQPPRMEDPAPAPTVAATPAASAEAAPAEDFSAVEETVEIEW